MPPNRRCVLNADSEYGVNECIAAASGAKVLDLSTLTREVRATRAQKQLAALRARRR